MISTCHLHNGGDYVILCTALALSKEYPDAVPLGEESFSKGPPSLNLSWLLEASKLNNVKSAMQTGAQDLACNQPGSGPAKPINVYQ